MDGSPCGVQPLTSKGRLSAMCIRDKRIFACTVEGQLLVISCNPLVFLLSFMHRIQSPKEFMHSLDVLATDQICYNCCIMRLFKAGKDYAVLGTAEGMVYLYEIMQNKFVNLDTFLHVIDTHYQCVC